MQQNYIISGGSEGKERLNLLTKAMAPFSFPFIKNLIESENVNSFLDVGCGGGGVLFYAANKLGENSKAVGIDFDETILNLSQKDAEELNIKNVELINREAHNLEFKNEFDLVYARFLLSHNNNPQVVISEMFNAAKNGKIIAAEDVQFSGHFSYPENAAFNKYVDLYSEAVKLRIGDSEIGPKLPLMFEQCGIKNVNFNVVQPVHKTGIEKMMAYVTFEKIKNSLLELSLISEIEINNLLEELLDFTKNPDSIISMPRIFQVRGRKEF